ncbi:hypothetical protein UlMin_017241 [Ulmus minor]
MWRFAGSETASGNGHEGNLLQRPAWLNSYPLDRNLVFDYFALSPFYDWTCNNEQLRMRSIHPLDLSQLSKMIGLEYMLNGLYVIQIKPWQGRALYYISKAFTTAASKLEKIGYGSLPPAAAAPFPEGYVPPAAAVSEKGPETQQAGEAQPPTVDPIIDQGPPKRMRF